MAKSNRMFSDENITATPAEMSALTRNLIANFNKDLSRPPVDLHDKEQVVDAINEYLSDCEQAGKRPGNMGLYRALGLSRQDVNNVFNGKLKNKLSPECVDILKKAMQYMSEYREQLGAMGRLNPATLVFWQKNHDQFEDYTRIEVSPTQAQIPQLSPAEIQKQIEQDIPIDAEYTEHDV